jgi:hypothetical protein
MILFLFFSTSGFAKEKLIHKGKFFLKKASSKKGKMIKIIVKQTSSVICPWMIY